MENDYEIKNIDLYPKENEDNIFRLEYKDQNIYNTPAFKNWQNSQFRKYGENAKLFQCLDDNIYFYVSKKEYMKYYYEARCPICTHYICYFCLLGKSERYFDCCLYKRFFICFNVGHNNFNSVTGPLDAICRCCDDDSNCWIALLYMIPFLNMIFIIGSISSRLFYTRRSKYINDNDYMYHLEHIVLLVIIIHLMFAIAISLPFILYNICIVLFIWIISIPFELAPVKYFANVVNEGFYY